MSEPISGRVGSALTWKTVQFGAHQGFALLRFLILARILAPEDFGLLAIATVAVDLLVALTNVGLLPALIQMKAPEDRHYNSAWTVATVRGVALGGVLFLGAGPIAALYGQPDATPLLQLIALRPVISGLASPRLADQERELYIRAMAVMTAAATILQKVVSNGLAPTIDVFAVIFGMLAGTALYTVLSYGFAPHRPRFRLDRTSTGPILRFGRWVLATSVIVVVGEAALRAVISRRLGAAELGVYYVAARLAYLPSDATSEIVGSIAFPLHARLRDRPRRAAEALALNLRALIALLLPAYLILGALAPSLTGEILGSAWAGTAPVIVTLAAAALLGVVADAVNPMLKGRGRPERITIMVSVRSIVLVSLAWPLASAYGVAGAAVATLAAEVPVQIIAATFARRMLPHPFANVWQIVVAASIAGATGAGAGAGVATLAAGPIGVVAAGIVAGAGSVAGLWLLDRVFRLRLSEQLAELFPALRRVLRTPSA
jgi:O-antigen/teichoic acid export membrane protein